MTDDSEDDELYCWNCESKMECEPDGMDLYKEYLDDGKASKYDD